MFFEHSQWTYDTGATGGVGIAFVAASGGAIYLKDPRGNQHTFYYGGLGAGFSGGFKIPKLGRIPQPRIKGTSVSAAGSAKFFKSGGLVFKSERLGSTELTKADIQGAVVFVEGALGLIAGASGDAMLFGINPVMLAAGLATPALSFLVNRAISNARGALLMGGVNVGPQAGWGIAGLVGYLH